MRNIGERRLAPTLTVRGVAGTAPYLRDGSYPRIRDLEHLARTLFRGYSRRAPGRAHTLEAFVESLPRKPSPGLHRARDLTRERRGLDVFVRAGCPTCHAFPAFTNLGQHPLGTLFPDRAGDLGADSALDVPSLIGVARGGPFLTDGRAESLEAVVRDHNDAGRHGQTRGLDDEEIADLVHFLEML
jgi:cytochrome c peroxidase